MYSTLRWLVALVLVTLAWVPASAASPDVVRGQKAMVASRSMIASEVGRSIMRRGGNAIDAAVATGFALAVAYPSAGNLGGGGFMVIRLHDGTVTTNDHRERAPGAAHRDMYLDAEGKVVKGLSTASHLAVGVPGTVAGLLDVLERHGTMSVKQAVEPALQLARDGFPLNWDIAQQFKRRAKAFAPYPASVAAFSKAGVPYEAGDTFRQADLAKTLERISKKGRAGFYEGKTADLIVAEMKRGNGLITHEDLKNYQSVWREPIRGSYRGHTLISMPPPSSGGVLLVQMLNMLEAYDLSAKGFGSAATMHLMIEAERRAYSDRAEYLGDSDFYPVPVARLTNKSYATRRFADFDVELASASSDIEPGTTAAESIETTHASFMDGAGNAVAYTTTLNGGFGAKIVVDGGGFLLNNEMDDFSIKEDTPNMFGLIGREANAIEPGKRMLSSMTPTIVLKDGQPVLVTGSPGGSTIITTVLQVVVNVIDHGMRLSDAVGQPRFHHQWQPDRIVIEPLGFSPDTLNILRGKGHEAIVEIRFGRGIGDANSVMRIDGELQGMSDPRNSGGAAGF